MIAELINKFNLVKHIVGISVVAAIVLSHFSPANYAGAVTSGLSPAPIDYLNNVFVTSAEFKRAIVGDFCEIVAGTNECSQNTKSVIFGEAVLKYKSGFSKDPTQVPVSPPFGLFILDDEIYVTFVPGNTGFPSNFTNPELADSEFNFTPRDLEVGTRLLPGGLDRHRYFSYRLTEGDGGLSGIRINLYTADVLKEANGATAPDGKSVEGFVVNSVTPYTKLKLTKTNKILTDFAIDLK